MESIEKFVIEQLAAWQVPGCAAAAVQDGEIVLAAGWGQRDLESGLPVTSDTLFAVGSTTKAFTAATVGWLADEGLLEWNRPLRDYLPDLRLHDPVVTERLTITDLLSHRSGLPRHDLVWLANPGLSREELVRRLRFLPLSKDLRETYQYCNLGYVLAGHVVDVLGGRPWEAVVQSQLLTPLGMSRSTLSVGEMIADPDHATGYEHRAETVVPVPPREQGAVGPAGGINSSAADMARWLLAQLGEGQVAGQAVMSPGTLLRQHSAHMLMPEDRTFPASTRHAYGFGWGIGRYREHRIASHGGGIDGYQAMCALLPDDGIGVVVLTNMFSGGALPAVVAYRVVDELLGLEPTDWSAAFKPRHDAALSGSRQARDVRHIAANAGLPRPLDAYVGEYRHPGYGTIVITEESGALKLSFGALKMSLTHRHYETFDLELHELGDQPHIFALMFRSDPDGDITALTVPLEPTVEPLPFSRLPDVPDPEVLRRLCGTYSMGPVELIVGQKSEHVLTVAAPGSPPVELQPKRGLRFGIEGRASRTYEFELDETGAVTRLIAQPFGIFLPRF